MRIRLLAVSLIVAGLVAAPAAFAQDKGGKSSKVGKRSCCPVAQAQAQAQASACCGKDKPGACCAKAAALKPQSVCPIMGGKIDKKVFVDVGGYRFYACCPGCLDKIKANPEKSLATLKAKGEAPERRLAVCTKCGEIKGTAKCCQPGATKCAKCKLNKGSVGCCRDLKTAGDKGEVILCAGCGEIKGSAKCCQPGATKCAKCGLDKGAPGCCKLAGLTGQCRLAACPGCGEVKGSQKCCAPGAPKCPKCGLNKGAPGCCKTELSMKSAAK